MSPHIDPTADPHTYTPQFPATLVDLTQVVAQFPADHVFPMYLINHCLGAQVAAQVNAAFLVTTGAYVTWGTDFGYISRMQGYQRRAGVPAERADYVAVDGFELDIRLTPEVRQFFTWLFDCGLLRQTVGGALAPLVHATDAHPDGTTATGRLTAAEVLTLLTFYQAHVQPAMADTDATTDTSNK